MLNKIKFLILFFLINYITTTKVKFIPYGDNFDELIQDCPGKESQGLGKFFDFAEGHFSFIDEETVQIGGKVVYLGNLDIVEGVKYPGLVTTEKKEFGMYRKAAYSYSVDDVCYELVNKDSQYRSSLDLLLPEDQRCPFEKGQLYRANISNFNLIFDFGKPVAGIEGEYRAYLEFMGICFRIDGEVITLS